MKMERATWDESCRRGRPLLSFVVLAVLAVPCLRRLRPLPRPVSTMSPRRLVQSCCTRTRHLERAHCPNTRTRPH